MRCVCALAAIVFSAGSLFGSLITVDTSASATATYSTYSQTAGPFPWSDLGIDATAGISAGSLNVATGGSTSYALATTITGGEMFTPGSTTLQLGYTPGWTGSLSGAANGDLNSKFVYNIGPISGSATLFNVPLSGPAVNADLSSSLNAGFGLPVNAAGSANGPGVSTGFTVAAQAFCPFCVTIASASLGINIGTRIDQSVTATPTVTNADLVWYSTTQTYSPSDTFTLVSGSGGDVNNTFATPPASLGLTNGETFYMNILPVVELNMPVLNLADVAVPASIFASWSVFGAGGSATYPLGDLYTLSNGGETFGFDPTFYANFFYSQALVFTQTCTFPGVPCTDTFETPASDSGPTTNNTGIPVNLNPPVTIGGGSPTPGGYGIRNNGALVPGDPSSSDVCGPAGSAFAGECINQVDLTRTPEPEAWMLCGIGMLLLMARLRRRAIGL